MEKPRITPADQRAYARIAGLAIGTVLTVDGQAAKFDGMAGYLIALKVKRRAVYLRVGDPLIREITL